MKCFSFPLVIERCITYSQICPIIIFLNINIQDDPLAMLTLEYRHAYTFSKQKIKFHFRGKKPEAVFCVLGEIGDLECVCRV